jgi:hypothetical protein
MVLKLIINQNYNKNYNKNYLNINNFVIFIKFITSGTPRGSWQRKWGADGF